MTRIAAGYTIEHEELVSFLKAQGFDPDPDEPEYSVYDAWASFLQWHVSLPRNPKDPNDLPWPQCVLSAGSIRLIYLLIFSADWQLKDGGLVIGFMMRYCRYVENESLRYKQTIKDKEIRDKFIQQTGSILDANMMRFWSMPASCLGLPADVSTPEYM